MFWIFLNAKLCFKLFIRRKVEFYLEKRINQRECPLWILFFLVSRKILNKILTILKMFVAQAKVLSCFLFPGNNSCYQTQLVWKWGFHFLGKNKEKEFYFSIIHNWKSKTSYWHIWFDSGSEKFLQLFTFVS